MKTIQTTLLAIFLLSQTGLSAQEILYKMPAETELHEATWLVWPHDYGFERGTRESFEPSWVEMTKALTKGEKVYIVAYNQTERAHIENVLNQANVPLDMVEFFIHQNESFWVRDTGPIFVYDQNNNLKITDWGYDSYGNGRVNSIDDKLPGAISSDINVPRIDVGNIVLEGGSIEVDGEGTLIATRSSILGSDRNPGLTEAEMNAYFKKYLGITNVIWLDGTPNYDITDCHIDALAKFLNPTTIITMDSLDLLDNGLTENDVKHLYSAKDANGNDYNYIFLPQSVNNVITSYGEDVGYPGSYLNYYIGNKVVLVPNYNDPNDAVANQIIQNMYPDREVIGIDSRDLYVNGGMVHCVTQQQPAKKNIVGINGNDDKSIKTNFSLEQSYPNPFNPTTTIKFEISNVGDAKFASPTNVSLKIYDLLGNEIATLVNEQKQPGNYEVTFDGSNLSSGVYFYKLQTGNFVATKKMIMSK